MGLVELMANMAKRVFPKKFLRNIDLKLESTKIVLAAEEYVGVSLLVAVGAGIVTGLLGALLWTPSSGS